MTVGIRLKLDGGTAEQIDRLNAAIVADMHESGIAVPSTTMVGQKVAIRAAIVNHRTELRDIDALLRGVAQFGAASAATRAA